jgi:ketosteroid isomerase-like protein
MKKPVAVLLAFCSWAALAIAQGKPPVAGSATTVQELKQLELDWSEAARTGNADKLAQILGDEWTALDYLGNTTTKKDALAELKAKSSTLSSFEPGPMDVVVFGNTAVVQGSDTEKSTYKGKDSSGKYVWMDVFVKRNGKWQAVRSQSAKVQ